ncbi:RNA-directed DNA polymerase [Eubacteriales bacterium OttesenSCG-928-A19]|nr:RNA-directed DNA polymerase [Eubacteriales bacterium OttesenSCG-928-A19]
MENCRAAIEIAAKEKKYRAEVKTVLQQIDEYAICLHELIATHSYKPTPYRIIRVADGLQRKEREIQVPAFFPDQCIHHALMNILAPLLEKRMYYWSCGSRRGKGIAHAKKGIERATLQDPKHAKYAVKLDIAKCYPSIDNARLFAAFQGIVKDPDALRLIRIIIGSCEGLPIGNYTSAWFCNFYLTRLDRIVKEKHKIRHYVRYIDDMVLIDSNKRKLRRAILEVERYARDSLGLTLHDHWSIFKVRRAGDGKKNRPIDFVGYCFCVGYTTLRKRNALAIMRQSRRIRKRQAIGRAVSFRMAAGFLSRTGQLKHCKAQRLKQKYVDTVNITELKEVIRNESARQQRPAGRFFS